MVDGWRLAVVGGWPHASGEQATALQRQVGLSERCERAETDLREERTKKNQVCTRASPVKLVTPRPHSPCSCRDDRRCMIWLSYVGSLTSAE